MKTITSPARFQAAMEALRKEGKSIGFVPTMGALHEGHLSLIRRARRENDVTVASIFVNPAQFGPKEDFARYPRPFREDCRLLAREKTAFLFAPSAAALYPEGFSTRIEPGPEAEGLCGRFRPGHFRGVATVVAKLFHIVHPHRAYFGAKDFQQTVVIRRMTEDLDFDVKIVVCPTVREKDGLAMSSRNRYLSPAERETARELPLTLFEIRDRIRRGRKDFPQLMRLGLARLRRAFDRVDYLEIVDPETLRPVRGQASRVAVLAAVRTGKTRLIDNVIIPLPRTA